MRGVPRDDCANLGAIDFGDIRQLFTSNRAVRTGICANPRTVHGQLSTFQKPHFHTLLDDSFEEFEEERRLLKTAVVILGKCGVMRNLLIETQPGEPTISQMHSNILDQATLTSDSVKVANQEDA